jgi:hypothetical protein
LEDEMNYLFAGIIALVLIGGAYMQGRADGYDKRVAEQAAKQDQAIQDYTGKVTEAFTNAAHDAASDFIDKTAVLNTVATTLKNLKEKINGAAAELSRSLRDGGCFLTPQQRRLLECIRRPNEAGCAGISEEAVRPSLSGKSTAPPAASGPLRPAQR